MKTLSLGYLFCLITKLFVVVLLSHESVLLSHEFVLLSHECVHRIAISCVLRKKILSQRGIIGVLSGYYRGFVGVLWGVL